MREGFSRTSREQLGDKRNNLWASREQLLGNTKDIGSLAIILYRPNRDCLPPCLRSMGTGTGTILSNLKRCDLVIYSLQPHFIPTCVLSGHFEMGKIGNRAKML